MRNILIKMRFLGTNYHGWQVQENAVSVQEVFQDSLSKILGKREPVIGCSRTDTGVHANMYCLTFKIDSDISCFKLTAALNA